MQNWKVKRLCELGEIVGGATPSTNREDYYNGDIAWLTPKDLAGYNSRYISRGERSITTLGLGSCSAKILPKGSILFTSRAPIGYIAIAQNDICTNQGFKSIVPNTETDSMFLYYLLQYNKAKIEAMGSGTTFKEVSGAVMKNIEVRIPDFEEQKNISSILASIDDKIELNNRINKNLEAQAQAIYKCWFVDFEPFQDGEFVDSELGRIPKGWEIAPFTKYISILGGGTPKTDVADYWDGNIPFFTPKDTTDSYYSLKTEKQLSELGITKCNSKLFDVNTVFVTARGTVGKIALAGIPMAMNQSCYALISENLGQIFVHQLSMHAIKKLIKKANGAVFNALVTRDFETEFVCVPPMDIVKKYTDLVVPLYNSILSCNKQMNILSTLRDTLLPKLMSGEIQIPQEV